MGKIGTLDSWVETIGILRDRWWPEAAAKQEGNKISKKCFHVIGTETKRIKRPKRWRWSHHQECLKRDVWSTVKK